jgi:hypothetical protein
VLVGTAFVGLCTFDVSNSASARILWGTGRGNEQRTGSILSALPVTLASSNKWVEPSTADEGDTLQYQIKLQARGGDGGAATLMADTLPVELSHGDDLWASTGIWGHSNGTITWTGTVSTSQAVTVTYSATIHDLGGASLWLENEALVGTENGETFNRSAMTLVNGKDIALPVVLKD